MAYGMHVQGKEQLAARNDELIVVKEEADELRKQLHGLEQVQTCDEYVHGYVVKTHATMSIDMGIGMYILSARLQACAQTCAQPYV